MILANLTMKAHFKIFIILFFLICFVFPLIVFGQNKPEQQCLRYADTLSKFQQALSDKAVKISEMLIESDSIFDRRQENKEKLKANRAESDEKRPDYYVKLAEKAKTDSQKLAVETFKATVEAAIKTRRDAIDAALDVFHASVKNTVSARKSAIELAVNNYRAAAKAAAGKAELDCESGILIETVRNTFKESLKIAKDKLMADRQSVDKIRDGVNEADDVFKYAKNKAVNDFRKDLNQAKDVLKESFNESAE